MALTAVAAIATAAQPIIILATTLWGAWQAFRRAEVENALDLSDQALASLISVIEIWGRSSGNEAKAAELKRAIQAAQLLAGTERAKLAPLVKEVVSYLEAAGVFHPAKSEELRKEAAQGAVERAIAAHRKATLALLLCVSLLGLSGCAAQAPRVTQEDVVQGSDGRSWIAVTWPEETQEAELETMRGAQGRLITVAPIEPPQSE